MALISSKALFAADIKKADSKVAIKVDAKSEAKTALIDINSATERDLKAIAGIGDRYAGKIIAGRPYAKKDQLKSRNILPSPLYEQVKDRIIAKQPKKDNAKEQKKR